MRRVTGPCLLALLLSFSTACASQTDLLRKATASYLYFEHRYEQECVVTKGPPECKQRQAVLDSLRDEVEICNEAHKIGPLPGVAETRLRALMKQAEK